MFNDVVGGVPVAISIWPDHPGRGKGPHYRGGQGGTALDVTGLQRIQSVIQSMRDFVDQVYVPDTLAIAGFYKDWFARGEGLGNFMTYGDFPADGKPNSKSLLIPRGVIVNRDLSHIEAVDLDDPEQIQEFASHSWYEYQGGKGKGLHPYDGETKFAYDGPKPPYDQLDVSKGYSWLKSPRWRGKPMEVGPLARVLMLYATGHKQTKELADFALKKLDAPITALFSTLGRTAARTLETKIIADEMGGWLDTLIGNFKKGDLAVHNPAKWEPSTWPASCKGVGYMEAPRGALAHWIVIKNGKIDNYQAVVPSTWNAGPRDGKDQPGAYEAALQDRHVMAVPEQPLEIQRTIHSFDPCIACAVHVVDPNGAELTQIRVS